MVGLMSGNSPKRWTPPRLEVNGSLNSSGLREGGQKLEEPESSAKPAQNDVEDRDDSARGYETGFAEGLREGRQRLSEVAQQLGNIGQQLALPVSALEERLESSLVALALEIARRIVLREVSASPETIKAIVNEALHRVPVPMGPLSIVLHPEDFEAVMNAGVEIDSDLVRYRADPSVERGGCLVQVLEAATVRPEKRWHQREESHAVLEVDATIERRWRQVLAALFDEDLIQ